MEKINEEKVQLQTGEKSPKEDLRRIHHDVLQLIKEKEEELLKLRKLARDAEDLLRRYDPGTMVMLPNESDFRFPPIVLNRK